MMQPSQIILQVRWAVLRASSKPKDKHNLKLPNYKTSFGKRPFVKTGKKFLFPEGVHTLATRRFLFKVSVLEECERFLHFTLKQGENPEKTCQGDCPIIAESILENGGEIAESLNRIDTLQAARTIKVSIYTVNTLLYIGKTFSPNIHT